MHIAFFHSTIYNTYAKAGRNQLKPERIGEYQQNQRILL